MVLVPTIGLDGLQRAGSKSNLVLDLALFVAASAPVPARGSLSPLLDLQPAAAQGADLVTPPVISTHKYVSVKQVFAQGHEAPVSAHKEYDNMRVSLPSQEGKEIFSDCWQLETTCHSQSSLAMKSAAGGLCPWQVPCTLGPSLEALRVSAHTRSGGNCLVTMGTKGMAMLHIGTGEAGMTSGLWWA